ncbi:pleckstrin domain-containing protein, partial [Planoprotostelium fungivorum]
LLRDYDRREWPVSKKSLEFLVSKEYDPCVKPEPGFFDNDNLLTQIRSHRFQLKATSDFMKTCRTSLTVLKNKRYLLDEPNIFAIRDLLEPKPYHALLSDHLNQITSHITSQCETCKGKGHICMKCYQEPPIFPFQSDAVRCPGCKALYHIRCQSGDKFSCPICDLKEKKREEKSNHDDGNAVVIGQRGINKSPKSDRPD